MAWFLEFKFWLVKFYYRVTGRGHISDLMDLRKQDPYIYEE
jgi:hypothetical protein